VGNTETKPLLWRFLVRAQKSSTWSGARGIHRFWGRTGGRPLDTVTPFIVSKAAGRGTVVKKTINVGGRRWVYRGVSQGSLEENITEQFQGVGGTDDINHPGSGLRVMATTSVLEGRGGLHKIELSEGWS